MLSKVAIAIAAITIIISHSQTPSNPLNGTRNGRVTLLLLRYNRLWSINLSQVTKCDQSELRKY